MFLLVSGSSASGKTTLVQALGSRIENLVCHDADEKMAFDAEMRCRQLEEWVQLALRHQDEERDFLLAGQSPLGELLACPSAPKLSKISATLLDCHDTVRIQRMRDRGFDPKWPPSQDFLNWAAWHRMHAWDPQWEQRVITSNAAPDHPYNRWTTWQQTDPRWQVNVIDTTTVDAETMREMVTAWVQLERENASLLTADAKWWE